LGFWDPISYYRVPEGFLRARGVAENPYESKKRSSVFSVHEKLWEDER
jgi:hypothetical protein